MSAYLHATVSLCILSIKIYLPVYLVVKAVKNFERQGLHEATKGQIIR